MKCPQKKKFLDFVLLTGDEHTKLVDRFGLNGTTDRIEALNNYLGSKGRKYRSHYYTILVWDKKDNLPRKKPRLFPIIGKTCGERKCRLPAVYKDSSGAYDYFRCVNHLPKEVKELYE